jgi:WD40 repeat protein
MPSGLDFSPDGLKLAVANSNEGFLIDIYSTATIRSLWLHDAPISAIRYQPIDGTVLSASDDGLVVRWNPEPPSGDRSFFGHKRHVRAVEFDGSGAMLASVAADGFGARWDLGSGVPLNSFFPKQGSYDLFNDIAIAPSGNAIALAEIAPPFVALFSVEETEAKFQWAQKLSNIVTRVEISPDGKIVAAGDLNGQLALFSASDGELFGTLDATAPVIDIRFNNDSEHLAAAATDGYIRIWSVESLAHQRSWKAHEPGETFLDWSPDNSMIATGGADGKVKLWRLEFEMPAEELVFAQQKGDLPQDQVQSSPTVQVKGVRFHPNAGWLASGHFDGKVRIWGQDGTELIDEIDTGRKRLFSLAVHPNQPVVASGYGSGVIEINRVQPDPVEQRLGDLGRRVTALDLTADGSLILAGTSSGALSLLASTQESVGSSIADHGSWVRAVAVSRDGQKVASAGIDRSIHVRARNGAVLGEPVVLKGHPASVRALAWSPGADVLASSSDAGDVRIWRLPDFTSTTLVGGSSDSSTLAFSRDGRLVFAGGPQSIARWDAETGTEIRSIPLPDEIVTVLTSCDARDVIAVGTDVGTIRLFAPFTGELQGVLLGHYAGIASLSFDPRCRVLSSRSRDGSWIIWDVLGRVPLRHTQNRADVSAGPLFSGAGRSIIFGLANGEVYRHAFAPWDLLIANGSTPSDRASMLSEALQRLWGLRVSGFNLGKDPHHDIGSSEPRVWARTRSRFSLPSFEGLEHFAESDSSEFDMSPLLAPASATGEKLDQVLDWLAEQEERVPRLRPGYEPAAAGRQ